MKRIALIVLLTLMVSVGSAEVQQTNDITQAIFDAKKDAKSVNSTIWLLGGCGLSVLGVLIAYAHTPKVPVARLVGKSPDYTLYYMETYRSAVKRSQLQSSVTGCVLGTLLSAVLYYNVNSESGVAP